jgi:hypothetical protein
MIKLLTALAGADFSYRAGETVSLDKDFEKRLVDSGQAESVAAPKAKAKAKAKSE